MQILHVDDRFLTPTKKLKKENKHDFALSNLPLSKRDEVIDDLSLSLSVHPTPPLTNEKRESNVSSNPRIDSKECLRSSQRNVMNLDLSISFCGSFHELS